MFIMQKLLLRTMDNVNQEGFLIQGNCARKLLRLAGGNVTLRDTGKAIGNDVDLARNM